MIFFLILQMSRKNVMNIPELLKSKQLSLTQGRIHLLQILSDTPHPISGKEIEKTMGGKCDRATIYRNLSVLSSMGIIQKILSENSLKFKFSPQNNLPDSQNDHIHFQCDICHKTICMEDLRVNDFPLPEGFSKIENQFLILGICRNCNNERKIG